MRKSPTLSIRVCESCGIDYQPTGNAQRFCADCSALRDIARKRAYELRKNPNRKPKEKCTDPCCVCGGPFSCRIAGKPYCNTHYQRMRLYGTPDLHPRQRTNTYVVDGDVTTVTTKSGECFIIDTSDLSAVQRYSWCFSKTGYLVANTGKTVVKLHRYLLNPPKGVVVDHINGDRSDNRRSNLRTCSPADNSRNSSVSRNCKVGHLGIRTTPTGRFEARIMHNRKTIHIGTYDTLEEAISARKDAEARYFGEFAPSLSRS